MRRHRTRLARVVTLMLTVLAWVACAGQIPPTLDRNAEWVATWTAASQLTEPRNLPPAPGLSGSTLRQVVRVSLGGRQLRLRFSNLFGNTPISMTAAHVALSRGGSTIAPGSDRALTFRGNGGIVIPPGETVVSDPLEYHVAPLADLTVSVHFDAMSSDITGHPGSRTTSYLQAGDWTSAVTLPAATTTEHWYVLAGADVLAARGSTAVVALGNSITDGRGSGTDKNNRWTDNLARRLQADERTRNVAVLNAGIGGNAVLRGGLGPPALSRLGRDAFDPAGVRWLIVLAGVNDIGTARGAEAEASVDDQLIEAYKRIIDEAHRLHLRVFGGTILPFGGSQYDSPAHEAARQTVNRWIRTSRAYDGVIDFDAAMRDPANPLRLRREADSGDHLHPNEAGYRIMADAIDLALFIR
ncbi:MAG: SGNH/GDSL hydrolase family protein [Gemmatimonadaceae bacterium]